MCVNSIEKMPRILEHVKLERTGQTLFKTKYIFRRTGPTLLKICPGFWCVSTLPSNAIPRCANSGESWDPSAQKDFEGWELTEGIESPLPHLLRKFKVMMKIQTGLLFFATKFPFAVGNQFSCLPLSVEC